MPPIEVPFGCNTHCFLSECACCGKPYSTDGNEVWRTVYAYSEEHKTVMWLLYCIGCFEDLMEEDAG